MIETENLPTDEPNEPEKIPTIERVKLRELDVPDVAGKIGNLVRASDEDVARLKQLSEQVEVLRRERYELQSKQKSKLTSVGATDVVGVLFNLIRGIFMRDIKTTIAAGIGFVVLLLAHFGLHVSSGLEQALLGVSAWVVAIFADSRDWRTILTGVVGTLAYVGLQLGITVSPDVQIILVGIILQLTGLGARDQPSTGVAQSV